MNSVYSIANHIRSVGHDLFQCCRCVYVVNVIEADKFVMRKKREQIQIITRFRERGERQKVLIFMR